MTTTPIAVYATTSTDVVHLYDGLVSPGVDLKTFCGRPIDDDWMIGDETVSGRATTCISCRQKFPPKENP